MYGIRVIRKLVNIIHFGIGLFFTCFTSIFVVKYSFTFNVFRNIIVNTSSGVVIDSQLKAIVSK